MTISLGKRLGLEQGDALVVVDVQRDFLPGGSLPVPDGKHVISPLNAYMAAFAARGLPIFVTRDWHPPDHCSFRGAGGRWPPHCVQGTAGAEWPAELCIPPEAHVISKATEKNAEAYSGFSGTSLATLLRDLHVRRLFIGGLATDYCVHDTALDARSHGFEVVILGEAVRAVNAKPDDAARAIEDMIAHGASLHVRP
ncbi:MAG TPA: isochorismatase family protein [Steroidobacteraceae bacterium]|nr:isochorismatase family protein [Steroidobacteraceae bacterium]